MGVSGDFLGNEVDGGIGESVEPLAYVCFQIQNSLITFIFTSFIPILLSLPFTTKGGKKPKIITDQPSNHNRTQCKHLKMQSSSTTPATWRTVQLQPPPSQHYSSGSSATTTIPRCVVAGGGVGRNQEEADERARARRGDDDDGAHRGGGDWVTHQSH